MEEFWDWLLDFQASTVIVSSRFYWFMEASYWISSTLAVLPLSVLWFHVFFSFFSAPHCNFCFDSCSASDSSSSAALTAMLLAFFYREFHGFFCYSGTGNWPRRFIIFVLIFVLSYSLLIPYSLIKLELRQFGDNWFCSL